MPEFSSSTHEYAATTVNATNKVVATATNPSSEIKIMLGDTEIENGQSATWVQGEGNLLTITVDDDAVYTVMVTAYPSQTAGEEVSIDIAGRNVSVVSPAFNETAINAAIAAQDISAAALIHAETSDNEEGNIIVSLYPVVDDLESNEYVSAGIQLEDNYILTESFTKKYAIGAYLIDSGFGAIIPNQIIDVDENHVRAPFLAIRTFEDITDAEDPTVTYRNGWNVYVATIDKSDFSKITDVVLDATGLDSLIAYVGVPINENSAMALEGTSASALYNGLVYILS